MARIDSRATGNAAEQLAYKFLKKRGLEPVARNFHCRMGEIDLIMLDDNCLVFVEVRYRAIRQRVPARLTIDYRKQLKLTRAAAMFLVKNPGFAQNATRFDVVALDGDAMQWITDAFRPHAGSF